MDSCNSMNMCQPCVRCRDTKPSPSPADSPTEEQVLKAVYESGIHQYAPGVIRSKWKDGIEIDVPAPALMNFTRKIMAASISADSPLLREMEVRIDAVCGFVREYEKRKYEIMESGGKLLSVATFMVDYCEALRKDSRQ